MHDLARRGHEITDFDPDSRRRTGTRAPSGRLTGDGLASKLASMVRNSTAFGLRWAYTGAALCTLSCHMQMQAESSFSGSGGQSATAANAQPATKKRHAHGSHHAGASFHKSGSISAHVEWHGRSGRICRALTPFHFVGMAKASGTAELTPSGLRASGHSEASGQASGGDIGRCEPPRGAVPKTPPPTPLKQHPEPEKARKPSAGELGAVEGKPRVGVSTKPTPTKPQQHSDQKPGEVPPEFVSDSKPGDPKPPTPGELAAPVEPPAEPPPNVFGYPTPVRGCFEGQVFPLETDAPKLPSDYAPLTPVSVLYACEWDIPARAWDQGFPGVADRFEWFAIRYSGAFHLAEAGAYSFRLSSDDGSKLVIDGKLVIDNDGQHPPREMSGRVELAAGDHTMTLEYFQGPRYQINLQLWVTPPGKPEELFTVR